MSLINDALKQAGKAQKENPPAPSPLEFRAAEESPRRPRMSAVVLIVLLVALMLGGVLIGVALQKNPATADLVKAHQPDAPAATAPDAATPPESTVPAAAVATKPVTTTAPSAAGNPSPGLSATLSPSDGERAGVRSAPALGAATDATTLTSATTNVVAAPAEPPKPVTPKLQGISYNPAQPSAVINGRTVYVGNRVGEFTVTKITQENVTLTSATKTNVLSLFD